MLDELSRFHRKTYDDDVYTSGNLLPDIYDYAETINPSSEKSKLQVLSLPVSYKQFYDFVGIILFVFALGLVGPLFCAYYSRDYFHSSTWFFVIPNTDSLFSIATEWLSGLILMLWAAAPILIFFYSSTKGRHVLGDQDLLRLLNDMLLVGSSIIFLVTAATILQLKYIGGFKAGPEIYLKPIK